MSDLDDMSDGQSSDDSLENWQNQHERERTDSIDKSGNQVAEEIQIIKGRGSKVTKDLVEELARDREQEIKSEYVKTRMY